MLRDSGSARLRESCLATKPICKGLLSESRKKNKGVNVSQEFSDFSAFIVFFCSCCSPSLSLSHALTYVLVIPQFILLSLTYSSKPFILAFQQCFFTSPTSSLLLSLSLVVLLPLSHALLNDSLYSLSSFIITLLLILRVFSFTLHSHYVF